MSGFKPGSTQGLPSIPQAAEPEMTNPPLGTPESARNARVAHRYDSLMREGEHGHYETMFRVVREEVERATLPKSPESAPPAAQPVPSAPEPSEPITYTKAKEMFVSWCDRRDFDPKCWDLWEAYSAGIQDREFAQGIGEELA